MTVECTLNIYEKDGERVPVGSPPLVVKSTLSTRGYVVLQLPDGKTFTVDASELVRAIGCAEKAH